MISERSEIFLKILSLDLFTVEILSGCSSINLGLTVYLPHTVIVRSINLDEMVRVGVDRA